MLLKLPCRVGSSAPAGAGIVRTRLRIASRTRRVQRPQAVLQEAHSLVDVASSIAQLAPLMYERVVLPCSSMSCGDVVYRSTLDPALRGELTSWGWEEFSLISVVLGYLSLPQPGVLQGAIDYYIRAPMKRAATPAYTKDDVIIGKQLGDGGFGTVFKAEIVNSNGTKTPVVVKKAAEFGEAEVWMNERLQLAAPGSCAEFIAAFDEVEEKMKREDLFVKGPKKNIVQSEAVWLMWKYEGDNTLWDLMKNKDFPYNLEPILLGRPLTLPKGNRRKAQIYKVIMRQLTDAVRQCHAAGIVHRDVKPQNCILSEKDRKIKLIDLGAGADLLLGTNYVPNEFLMDPRYAPPQQYIMSKQVPKPPPKPLAAMLAPALWFLNGPDRFDMYSVGMTFAQLAFPNLRNDDRLEAFSRRLSECGYDLREWRKAEEMRSPNKKGGEYEEGFAVLDLDGGEGWELLCQLLEYEPFDRPSASSSMLHPYLSAAPFSKTAVGKMMQGVGRAMNDGLDVLDQGMSGGRDRLTEAQLVEMLSSEEQEMDEPEPASAAPVYKSSTVAWWQQRRGELKRKLAKRRVELGKGIARTIYGVSDIVPRKPKPAAMQAPAPAQPAKPAPALAANGNGVRAAVPANGNGVRAAVAANGNGARAPAAAANGNGARANGNGAAAQRPAPARQPAANGNGNSSPAAAPLERILELINARR